MNSNLNVSPKLTLFTCFSLALIILGVRLQILDTYATATPYWDDWGIGSLLYNYLTSGTSFLELLEPANTHRLVFSKVLNIVLFELNEKQWDPIVSMAVNAILWTVTGLFLLLFARTNREIINPYPFIFIMMPMWLFPTALVNVIWGAQSHNYFMILFVLVGCWYITHRPFTGRWFFGIALLAAACLTMAGGTFASVSIMAVYLLKALFDKEKRKQCLQTTVAAAIIAVFGLFLIFSQESTGSPFAAENIGDFVTTLAKTLSWPLSNSVWPCVVFFMPVLLLAIKALAAADEKSKKVTAFILSICGYVIIVAIAIAYARGAGGYGPTRRYSEFLSLSIICGSLAILVLQQKQLLGRSRFNKPLILVWLICLFASIPTQIGIFQFTAKDRAVIGAANEQIVRDYLISGEESTFQNRRFRHVPFPNHERLANWLDKFSKADILPMELQVPEMNTDSTGDVFVKNGSILGSVFQSKGKYRGEDVIGSYNMKLGAQNAKGTYSGEAFVSKRSYLTIPTLGYLGHKDLSLELVEVDTGKTIPVNQRAKSSKFAEVWRQTHIKIPQGKYRLQASDQSDTLWFAFAAPRNMGRLSYVFRRLIDKGKYIWQLGAVLLLFALQDQIVNMFRLPGHRK